MARTDRQPTSGAKEKGLARLAIFSGKDRRRWLVISTTVVILGGGLFVWGIGARQDKGRLLDKYTVATESGSLPGVITASGELQAERRVNVSPKRQGLLEELYVDEGDNVSKGQALARMNSGDHNERLNELNALLLQAKAEFEDKKADFERRRGLYQQGALSADDHNEYRSRFQSRKAAMNAAQARVKQQEVKGSELIIRAPFNGVITSRFAEPGAFVTPTTTASASAGATSSSIMELSKGLEASAKVPESDIGRIRIGQSASVRVDAFPEQRFQAKVSEIAPRAEKTDNVTSFEVKLALIEPPPKLLIGMTADVDFQTGKTAESTLVPTVAIVTEFGKPGVLLVGKENQPSFQPVELGTNSGSKTAILSGLKPGTKIFIDLPPWAKQKRD